MCIERRRLSQTVASEWQTAFVVFSQNAMMCLAHCRQGLQQKSWKTTRRFLQDRDQDQDQDQMFKTKSKISWSKTKTKTFIFVLEAPRDHDTGLEDFITGLAYNPANKQTN